MTYMLYIYNEALGGTSYTSRGRVYKTILWIGISSTRQMKIIYLFSRTFDFLFTKTIRPWSIDKVASQNAYRHGHTQVLYMHITHNIYIF